MRFLARHRRHARLSFAVILSTGLLASSPAARAANIPGTSCGCLPADNIWNRDISTMPVHPMSSTWVNHIGASKNLDLAFGPPNWGMPFTITTSSTPKTSINFRDPDESDPGPYPFTASTAIEAGTGDYHAFMIDKDACVLYELFDARWNGGNPTAGEGAIFDLRSNALRPDGWTSADDAGLPIFPGLARWDEVQAGEIRHAFRFTAEETCPIVGSHLWPARFEAAYVNLPHDVAIPPMGARFRLKASYNISGYSAQAQVILRALQHYGMFLADVGCDWCLGGTVDPNWSSALTSELRNVPAGQFEVVDESSLMININSGQARQSISTDIIPPAPVRTLQ